MKISKIEIKRFRSILNLQLSIDITNNYITICGANNTGKTNVLRSLNLFFNPDLYSVAEDSPNHKYYGSRGGKSYPEISIFLQTDDKEITITREFGASKLENTIGIERFEGQKLDLGTKEIDKILNNFAFFYIPSINISFPDLINKLIDDVYDLEYSKSRFRGLKQELRESFEKYTNGIIEVLNSLAQEINPIFEEFNENWNVGFEFGSDVQQFKDLISNDIDFYLNDKSNRSIEGKGSGLQRLGYILLHSRIIEKIKKKNVIVLIDEPDVYLHQGLQKKLRDHLIKISAKAQVILTSHSPVFIDSYKLQNVFLLDMEIGESVTYSRTNKEFYPLNTKLIDLYDHDGLRRIKEYLGIVQDDYDILDSYNLLVEGGCDKKYIEETCRFFSIECSKIVSANGVSKFDKYLEFYNSFYRDKEIKPTILVLFDNDIAGRDEYKKLYKKKFNHIDVILQFVPTFDGICPSYEEVSKNSVKSNYEIEDFIYPEIIHSLANKILGKKSFNKVRYSALKKKISAPAFKEKGVLYNFDLLKNESNLETGHEIDFSLEPAKKGMSKLYNLQGDKKLAEKMMLYDNEYPKVQEFLTQIMDAKKMKK